MMTANEFILAVEKRLAEMLSRKGMSSIVDFSDSGDLLSMGMRYAVEGGGKRVRPRLVYLGAVATNNDCDCNALILLACGAELIHSYSLVHDDLPAMDNDDYRRGKLSTHKKFGEAKGILIGDALLTQASAVLIDGAVKYGKAFASAASGIFCGAQNMVVGQVSDLSGVKDENGYLQTIKKKTAAPIVFAFLAGATYACPAMDDATSLNYYKFAENLGIAFQLADDLLDKEKEKALFDIVSVERISELLDDCTENAIKLASSFPNPKEVIEFTQMLRNRTR